VEDWQEWQVRADQVATTLGSEVNGLEEILSQAGDNNSSSLRSFWSRFRQLKEKVRTAPAIKLDDKLALERRLRELGSRAYKAQESAMSQSSDQKQVLLPRIAELRTAGENTESPQQLRELRRSLDGIRKEFDAAGALIPADRQAVWDAWRDASQFVWQRLTELWQANEEKLRKILEEAKRQLEQNETDAVRRSVSRFFEALKTHEGRQNTITSLKSEANTIRSSANRVEETRAAQRAASIQSQQVPTLDAWKMEVDRNRESIARLSDEVQAMETELRETSSILEQAMLRGPLVEKRRKLSELERANRTLEQRIGQSEESPLIHTG
jgi:hypothetical protein